MTRNFDNKNQEITMKQTEKNGVRENKRKSFQGGTNSLKSSKKVIQDKGWKQEGLFHQIITSH
jgi:hypothetical protein